ncbi:hypothetical protein Phi14:2_gp017 [Cellulophaga phage phi14:2]|uniref:Transmembrane protein n=1 Tax=Cellulophaga phage phi14:2 TaxID=1327990 RepID=S0A266_9CAUD|nr:hypothetical protein Phi14:2_gp017 [Cellulophaga phage phi14:2]
MLDLFKIILALIVLVIIFIVLYTVFNFLNLGYLYWYFLVSTVLLYILELIDG